MPVTKKVTIDWDHGTMFWDGVLEDGALEYMKHAIAEAKLAPEPWKVVPTLQLRIVLDLPMPMLDPDARRQEISGADIGRMIPRVEWAWLPINASERYGVQVIHQQPAGDEGDVDV